MNTLDFAIETARQAGSLLREYYNPAGYQATLKADRTVVTEADLAADRFLRQTIRQAYPQDELLSEEDSTHYAGNTPYTWIIDPLDGTTNFSLGLHYWGVSIARVKHGYPDLAALYFPMLDELFSAQRGQGACLNGKALTIQPPRPDQPASFFSCCSRTSRHYQVELRYKARILGSAAYGLCTVARGSAVLAFEATPKVWDFAGSWPVIEEAGGVLHSLNGQDPFPLRPGQDYANLSFPLLAAATPALWQEGQQKITLRNH